MVVYPTRIRKVLRLTRIQGGTIPTRRVVPVLLICCLIASGCTATSDKATVREEQQTIKTYPFSDPDPVPILADWIEGYCRSRTGRGGTRAPDKSQLEKLALEFKKSEPWKSDLL